MWLTMQPDKHRQYPGFRVTVQNRPHLYAAPRPIRAGDISDVAPDWSAAPASNEHKNLQCPTDSAQAKRAIRSHGSGQNVRTKSFFREYFTPSLARNCAAYGGETFMMDLASFKDNILDIR